MMPGPLVTKCVPSVYTPARLHVRYMYRTLTGRSQFGRPFAPTAARGSITPMSYIVHFPNSYLCINKLSRLPVARPEMHKIPKYLSWRMIRPAFR